MMLSTSLFLFCLAATASAQLNLSIHNITRFADYRFENLAIRSNGQILTTTAAPTAQLYQIDPLNIRPPVLVAAFPDLAHATGIHELSPDVFYVATGNITVTDPTVLYPSTQHVFRVDMRQFNVTTAGAIVKAATIQSVANLPNGTLLNGMTSLPGADFVLVADTFAGLVWRVDVKKGAVSVAYKDATLAGPGAGAARTGVNGIRYFGGELYYCNTGAATLYKVAIGKKGYVSSSSKPVAVTTSLPCDDFTFDSQGNIFVASTINALFRVTPSGNKTLIAGIPTSNSSGLIGSTAVQFGRLGSDAGSLYVTTNGASGGITDTVAGAEGISRVDGVETGV